MKPLLTKKNMQKITSKLVIFTLLLNIIIPWLFTPTYATNYSFDSKTITQAVPAVSQKYEISLPRDIVLWDTLELFLSGSTDTLWGVAFMNYIQQYSTGSSVLFTTSSGAFQNFCDTISSGNIANCTFDEINKKYTLEAKGIGTPLEIGSLIITRTPWVIQTIPHIVAKAKKVAFPIHHTLIHGDHIQINTSSGNVDYIYTWSLDFTWNMNALLTLVNDTTSITGSYNSLSGTIELESKTPWIDFAVSQFITDGQLIWVDGGWTPNIVAVAQKEYFDLRNIASDETVSLSFSGMNFSGTISQSFSGTSQETIDSFITQLQNLSDINAVASGVTGIEITSQTPWVPFDITNITITGWKVFSQYHIPNQEAIAQVDYISLPRNMFLWDTLHYSIETISGSYSVSYPYTWWYLSWFVDYINTQSTPWIFDNIWVEISQVWLQTLKFTSKFPGTPFTGWSLSLTSNIFSFQTQTWIIAQAQKNILTLPRDFVWWDKMSFVIDGNVITQDFVNNHTDTLSWFVSKINAWSTNVSTSVSGNILSFQANTPGIWFDIYGLNIVNSIYPTILQVAQNPTLQTHTFFVPEILTGSELWLSISGSFVSWSSLSNLLDTINNQSGTLLVNATIDTNNLTLKANTPTNNFSLSSLIQTGNIFTGSITQTATGEIKASLELSIDDISSLSGNSLQVGNCTLAFTSGTWIEDYDCWDDNHTSLDLTWWVSPTKLAALMRWISGISDINNWTLAKLWTGTGVIFTTAGTQNSTTGIYFWGSLSGITLISNTSPIYGTKQIATLTLPRDFVSGDTLTVSLSGNIVSQSFYLSSWSSLNALLHQINALNFVSASLSGLTLTFEWKNIWESFIIWDAQFINSQNSTQTVSNDIWKSQITQILLPYNLDISDQVIIALDGNEKTFSGNNLISDIINTYSWVWISATSSWLNGSFILSSWVWQNFSINKFEITRNIVSNMVASNIEAVRNIEELKIPLTVLSGVNGDINIDLSGNIILQPASLDLSGTLESLNSKINNAWYISTYTTDGTYAIFTLTWNQNGDDFIANLTATWVSIWTQNQTPNTESGSQVDRLDLMGRNLNANDILTFSLTGNTLPFSPISLTGNTDLNTVYTELNTAINTNSWNQSIQSVLTGWVLELTSKVPGTSFGSWVLNISQTLATSSGIVQNIVAQKQIDTMSLSRNIVAWDELSLMYSGMTLTQTYSWSQNETLHLLVEKINNSFSGIFITTLGTNTFIFTATTAWIWFSSIALNLKNTSVENVLQINIIAQPQVTTVSLPEMVVGDILTFTLWWDTFSNTSLNTLLQDINTSASWVVNASYNSVSGSLIFTWKTPWVPFDTSYTLINTTLPVSIQTFIPSVDQLTLINPIWWVRVWLTYFISLNGNNYEYTTGSWDMVDTILNHLTNQINTSLTWAIASTGITILNDRYMTLRSYSSWISFEIISGIADKTPPIILQGQNNNWETLKSWDISTGAVSINEGWTLYFVLSGSNVWSWSFDTLISSGFAFKQDMLSNIASSVFIPQGIVDGVYNIIASDFWHTDTFSGSTFIPNYSSEVAGFITVDNTPPNLNISTQSWLSINTDTFFLTWITEPNTSVQIVGSGGIIDTFSDGSWYFSGTITLIPNSLNIIDIISTDTVGNITFKQISMIHDNLSPVINSLSYTNLTRFWTGNITIGTEANIGTEIFSWITLLASWVTNGSGNIWFIVPLEANRANNFTLILTDIWWNHTTQTGIVILQDNLAPNIVFNPISTLVHTGNINISGTTENNSNVSIINSWSSFTGISNTNGIFNINVILNQVLWQKTVNNLDITITDLAGNISSTGISITEDSIPNSLIIGTPSQITNQTNISITGLTKIWSTLDINGNTGIVQNDGSFSESVILNQNVSNLISLHSIDQVWNISTGSISIVQDNILPTFNITTSNIPTNHSSINIIGTTEANSMINITGWSGNVYWLSGTGWDFNIVVSLNPWVLNTLSLSSTDQAGNIGTGSFSILQDLITNFVTLWNNLVNNVNTDTFALSGTTKPNANITITGWSGIVNLVAGIDGTYTGTLTLNKNTSNNITVSSLDNTLSIATWGFIVYHDDVKPIITNFVFPISTNQSHALLSWDTENWAGITADNWVTVIHSIATTTGSFILNFPLLTHTWNSIDISVTDLAGNISTGSITIIHDDQAPIINNIQTNQSVNSGIMTFTYSFDTNENSNTTIYIGSWANVLSTLVATGNTVWLSHSWIISWFDSTKMYYYFIQTIDSLGNTYQSTITNIDTIPVITNPNPMTLLDITNLPLSNSWVTLSGATSVWSGFQFIWEILPVNQFYFSFSWWLITPILSWSTNLPEIILENNTQLYTTTGTLVFEKKVINGGEQIIWNIKQIFSPAVTIGGTPTIILNTPAKIKFSWWNTNWITQFAYKNTGTSVWNIWNIESWDCSVNYITKSVCAYTAWSDIIIKTLHFTDFSLVTQQSISNPTPITASSWWWGGGGWWIAKDYCPNWDYSVSYYDRICWTKIISEDIKKDVIKNVEQIVNTIPLKNTFTLGEKLRFHFLIEGKTEKVKYKWYEIITITWYNISEFTKKLSLWIINSKSINISDKKNYISIINNYIIARYELEISEKKYQISKNKYRKNTLLLKAILNKISK